MHRNDHFTQKQIFKLILQLHYLEPRLVAVMVSQIMQHLDFSSKLNQEIFFCYYM